MRPTTSTGPPAAVNTTGLPDPGPDRRLGTGYVAEKITRAIDILLYAHGAGSFADVNPLQRIWRDSATARHTVDLPLVGYGVYGKALLGV